ncbi:DinB family protein [Cellulomonas edaphi]|uniref:DinB family protein n=1 Tax=Cellulomonas edaphi TaxID=3053468 RepID=A0ABT7S8A7_9CELL|nr:DinB family protein [Cellulomons edaphi]MDM7831842.1 DinB family protein [Cellulomons edaphi]
MDEKATLLHHLRTARSDLRSKVDGLDDYDARRPLTPTGTNLLGLIKHVASVQVGYFTDTFGRPAAIAVPWFEPDAEPDADMWVPADESTASVLAFHDASAQASDAAIEDLPLDAPGTVPWWPDDRSSVTLHQILVHMINETARHAGHADIVRELIDGAAGRRPDDPSMPQRPEEEWARYRARIEEAARAVGS